MEKVKKKIKGGEVLVIFVLSALALLFRQFGLFDGMYILVGATIWQVVRVMILLVRGEGVYDG